MNSKQTAVIIPCGFKKTKVRTKAQHLYQGPYFKMNLAWALSVVDGSRVFILSAKHGLLRLTDELDPYDLKMGQPGSIGAVEIKRQAQAFEFDKMKLYAIGGSEYLFALKAAGLDFCAPIAGLSLGRSMQVLKRNMRKLPDWRLHEI